MMVCLRTLLANLLYRVIHELGGIKSPAQDPSEILKTPAVMADILLALVQKRITGQSAKKILQIRFGSFPRFDQIETIIKQEDLELQRLSDEDYRGMAQDLIDVNHQMAEKVRKGESGKLMWFVGQMMRLGKGSAEAHRAKAVLQELLIDNQ